MDRHKFLTLTKETYDKIYEAFEGFDPDEVKYDSEPEEEKPLILDKEIEIKEPEVEENTVMSYLSLDALKSNLEPLLIKVKDESHYPPGYSLPVIRFGIGRTSSEMAAGQGNEHSPGVP